MSHTISYGRAVIHIPRIEDQDGEHYWYSDDIFIPIDVMGSNNVIYNNSNKAARYLINYAPTSEEWLVIKHATEMAVATVGGTLRLNGRETTPEGYIRSWRKALSNPIDLNSARSRLSSCLRMDMIISGIDQEVMDSENDKIPGSISFMDDQFIYHARFFRDDQVDQYRRLRKYKMEIHQHSSDDDESGEYLRFIKNMVKLK